jgi:hypothetical protein
MNHARESASALPLQAEEWQGKNFSAKTKRTCYAMP